MTTIQRTTLLTFTALMGLSALSFPLAANASEAGKRNTALGIGAAAVALLLTQKNKLPGLVAAGGAAIAYSQYNNDVQARHRHDPYGYDDNSQNQDYRYGHTNSGYKQGSGYRVPQPASPTYNSPNYGDNSSARYNDNGGQNSRYQQGNDNSGDNRGTLRRTARRNPW